jgi:hypothetical protein
MGRIIMRKFSLKKSRSNPKLSLMNHSPRRSPAVPRRTMHKKVSIRAPVKYRPHIIKNTSSRMNSVRQGMNSNRFKNILAQQRNQSRNRMKSVRQGMNSNIFKNILAHQRKRNKSMKNPIGIKI